MWGVFRQFPLQTEVVNPAQPIALLPNQVVQKSFYAHLKKNQNSIRRIIIQISKAIELLCGSNIVHSDVKTQNILVKLKQFSENQSSAIQEVKLIDYGSVFTFTNLKQFTMATPQYMAPEILTYILCENKMQHEQKFIEYLKKYQNPWNIDIWSLGCVLLELVSGIPLWMSLKTIVKHNNNEIIRQGLFAIKGRLFDKIVKRQVQVVTNIDHYLSQQNYSGIILQKDLKTALKKMLNLNPSKRISPTELIAFLQKHIK